MGCWKQNTQNERLHSAGLATDGRENPFSDFYPSKHGTRGVKGLAGVTSAALRYCRMAILVNKVEWLAGNALNNRGV